MPMFVEQTISLALHSYDLLGLLIPLYHHLLKSDPVRYPDSVTNLVLASYWYKEYSNTLQKSLTR
jgi:hypothetical protein